MKFDFYSPCEGSFIKIEDFPDEIIADKTMGDGFGVNLTSDKIVAPFDGEVTAIFPTNHAICLTSNDGIGVMIHIGIDSYKISEVNKSYVAIGDKVNKGDLLIKTDVKKLKKLTGNTATAVVFLNGEKVEFERILQEVKLLENILKIEV